MLKRPYEVDGGGRMAGGDSLRCGSKGLKDTAYINQKLSCCVPSSLFATGYVMYPCCFFSKGLPICSDFVSSSRGGGSLEKKKLFVFPIWSHLCQLTQSGEQIKQAGIIFTWAASRSRGEERRWRYVESAKSLSLGLWVLPYICIFVGLTIRKLRTS